MIDQSDLFGVQEPPLARASDPVTSKIAAASAGELIAEHEALIVDALAWPAKPQQYEEIAERCGLDPVQVNRRLAAMRRRGLVRRLEVSRATSTGRPARLYTIGASNA